MKSKKTKRWRPKFSPISEEMKQWSAMLGEELQKWPRATSRPMFGMLGFYRGKKMFAALPATRGIGNPNSLIFRMQPMPPELQERARKEPRIDTSNLRTAKWFAFELSSSADVHDALWWLNQAYEHAK
jgi:hypothetical protein